MMRRSTLRSRLGCSRCKQRRVRCDQNHPVCNNCLRMSLDCTYETPPPRKRKGIQTGRSDASGRGVAIESSSGQEFVVDSVPQDDEVTSSSAGSFLGPSLANQNESRNPWDQPDFLSGVDPSICPADFNILYDMSYLEQPFPSFSFSDLDLGNRGPSQPSPTETLLQDEPMGPSIGEESCGSRRDGDVGGYLQGSLEDGHDVALATSPPVQPNIRTFLQSYFCSDVSPPASLLSMDRSGWHRLRNHLLRTAKKNESANHAILAVSELYAEQNTTSNPRLGDRPHQLDAVQLHELACQELGVDVQPVGFDAETQNALLVTIFCLAWFQTVCDDSYASQARFPQDMAKTVITSTGKWYPQSRLILKCLNSIDAKTSHMGGRQLLCPASLDVAFEHRFECENQAEDEADDESDVYVPPETSTTNQWLQRDSYVSTSSPWATSTQTGLSTLPRIIKMNVFNAILQPGLEFHIVSQRYSRRISSYESHHRTRGTAEDEYEVVTACKQLELELNDLWRRRPRVLEITMAELSEIVCEDVARSAISLFCVYVVTFWAHFVYIHRTAWWDLPLSNTAKHALDIMWRTMRRAINQPEEVPVERPSEPDPSEPDSSEARHMLHPGVMWALMLFGSECQHVYQQEWAVAQIRLIGTGPSRPSGISGSSSPEIRAQNALRASTLLQELIRRQTQSHKRLHWEELSIELFACHFLII